MDLKQGCGEEVKERESYPAGTTAEARKAWNKPVLLVFVFLCGFRPFFLTHIHTAYPVIAITSLVRETKGNANML